MRLFIFNVTKTIAEALLLSYLPWLDPHRYLDLSREVLLRQHGYVYIRRRIGSLPLPLVWHDRALRNHRSILFLIFSALIFFFNQSAFEVTTIPRTIRARVVTCSNKGLLNSLHTSDGVAHLIRSTAVCRSTGQSQFEPLWADGRLHESGNRILFGTLSYRCLPPRNASLLSNADYCIQGDSKGDPCNEPTIPSSPELCDTDWDEAIRLAGVPHPRSQALCRFVESDGVLLWVRGGDLVMRLTGITELMPVTKELIRRALLSPYADVRGIIVRALHVEATLRDRPRCEWGARGRVETGDTIWILKINPVWWIANILLSLIWRYARQQQTLDLDFTALGLVDRLRAEADRRECLVPTAKNFVFGVKESQFAPYLHLGPIPEGIDAVISPDNWNGRKIEGQASRARSLQLTTKVKEKMD